MLADIAFAPGELARLDRYEGREYRRCVIRTRASLRLVTAQTYVWRVALPSGTRDVPGGDFLGWLEQTGAPILRARNGT